MLILHLECATSYAGSVTCLERYLGNKKKKREVCDVVVFYNEFEGEGRFRDVCDTVKTVLRGHTGGISYLSRVVRNARLFFCLYSEIKRADVIHLNNGPGVHRVAIMLAKYMGKPLVVHLRSFFKDMAVVEKSFKRLPANTTVLAVSKAIKEAYRVTTDMEINVVYDGVEQVAPVSVENTLRQKLLGGRKWLVGYVGRLVEWKGIEIFVRAAVELDAKGADVRFIVIGEEEAMEAGYRRHLESIAAPAGDAIFFAGEIIAGLEEYFCAMDVFVLPSVRPEPFGIVVLEAMAYGVPVIATRQGGPLEIIEDGYSGVLIEPNSPSDMAMSITDLLVNGRKREGITQVGLEYVRARFDISQACEQYDYWFESAYAKGRKL